MRELIGLAYSPWTEKARWALDYHHIPYGYSEHLIIFGMPWLYYKMKSFGDITVPALICTSPDGDERFGDSFNIALYADRIGNEKSLFPSKYLDKISHYNELSETALDAARALVMERMQKNPQALMEALPSWVPDFLRPYLLFVAKTGISYIRHEFQSSKKTIDQHQQILRNVLLELRNDLKNTSSGYLLENFSYADITMALALHGVLPAMHPRLKISPAIKKSWSTPELASEFSDLIHWRDNLYQKFR